jgi:ATP-dependent Clp protease ATP-binding subunit ClpX
VHEVFRNFKFELPSSSVKQFEVTRQMIDDPETELVALLKRQETPETKIAKGLVEEFAIRFRDTHELELRFTSDAIERLVGLAQTDGQSVREICQERFKDFQFGLKLISQNTGQEVFDLDQDVISDPEKALSEWVVASYRGKEAEKSASTSGENENPPA